MKEIKMIARGNLKPLQSYFYRKSKAIIAFCIEFRSRGIDVEATGGGKYPCILFHLKTYKGNSVTETDLTEVSFPEYAGWDIWSVSCSKDHAYVCIIKNKNRRKK